jgi:hypothetical protein
MNNNKFDSFYFLHIPKTAGRFYTHAIIDPVRRTLINNDIKIIVDQNAHQQWHTEITNKTYITSLFRDPCEQLVSLYVHSKLVRFEGIKAITEDSNMDKDSFLYWAEKSFHYIKNYQSKHILFSNTKDYLECEMNAKVSENFRNNKLVTKDKVFSNISKISLLIKPQMLTDDNVIKLQNQILSDLNIQNTSIRQLNYNKPDYENIYSKQIYDSLTAKEKEDIKLISPIDCEIYETNSLFWNG